MLEMRKFCLIRLFFRLFLLCEIYRGDSLTHLESFSDSLSGALEILERGSPEYDKVIQLRPNFNPICNDHTFPDIPSPKLFSLSSPSYMRRMSALSFILFIRTRFSYIVFLLPIFALQIPIFYLLFLKRREERENFKSLKFETD